MSAKEYLAQLKHLDLAIDHKLSELRDLRVKAAAIGGFDYSRDRVMTSPPPDAPYAATIQKIIDLDRELNADVDRFVDLKHEIIERIRTMEDPRFAELLFKRYVEYKPFRMVENEMHYSHSYVLLLHRQALQAFDTLLQDDTQ